MLTFINSRQKQIELGLKDPFWLTKFEEKTDADIQGQHAPYQDGVTYIDSILSPKYIDIEIEIFEDTRYESTAPYVSSVFNPKLGLGLLIYEKNGVKKEIAAVSEHIPSFPSGSGNRVNTFQKGIISLKCPNPYWRSPNETTKPLVAYTGGFTLPFTLPFTLGTSGSKTTLYNNGDVPAPMRIEIHGPTTNPQIFNPTTGEHIRINRTIAEGEVMHINTESGRQRITVTDENGNESNAFGYLDAESSILSQFNLELGENEIEHVADAGNRHAEVIVRWDDMFVGV